MFEELKDDGTQSEAEMARKLLKKQGVDPGNPAYSGHIPFHTTPPRILDKRDEVFKILEGLSLTEARQVLSMVERALDDIAYIKPNK